MPVINDAAQINRAPFFAVLDPMTIDFHYVYSYMQRLIIDGGGGKII